MAERGGRSQPGDSQIGRDLGGVPAPLVFGHAQLLFLASAEPGRGEGEQKERQQRRQRGVVPGGHCRTRKRSKRKHRGETPPVNAARGVAARGQPYQQRQHQADAERRFA